MKLKEIKEALSFLSEEDIKRHGVLNCNLIHIREGNHLPVLNIDFLDGRKYSTSNEDEILEIIEKIKK